LTSKSVIQKTNEHKVKWAPRKCYWRYRCCRKITHENQTHNYRFGTFL